jgi:hypothetical protein
LDWIIPVSWSETASDALNPATANAAYAALRERGCAILRGVFSSGEAEALHREYQSQYGAMDMAQMQEQAAKPPPSQFIEVGEARYDITVRMKGAFAAPRLLANTLLRRFLTPLLGDNMRLNSFTVVASHPGAQLQHPHRDHGHLYPELPPDPPLPAHAINVAIPLIDVSVETGPTGFWLGSHKWPESYIPPSEAMTTVPFQRGDCILVDYRTLHTGLPNRSTLVRPIIYMTYARPWFFDECNHLGRSSLNMTLGTYEALPESVRPLLLRAHLQAMRVRLLTEHHSV